MFSNCAPGRPNGPTSCFAVRNPSGHKLLFGGTASSAKGVVKTSTPQLYPMYLISVADFLEETMLRSHQHLLVDRKLELHGAQHTGRVIYVSHREWRVRRTHDPSLSALLNQTTAPWLCSSQRDSPGARATRMDCGSGSFRACSAG